MSHSHGPHPTAPNSHAAITKHADIGVGHHTQKSFKSDRRDKPKHSGKLGSTSGPKKGGAGGKGTWGRPGDEARDLTLDANDPNYDPDEASEYEPTAGSWDTWHPSDTISLKFATSLSDMAKFKATIKSAAQEYLHSNDAKEFARIVTEFGMSVYHADLPYILIRWGLDHTPEERARINALLLSLHKQGLITQSQMAAGVRKLYNHLPDLLVDCPQAKLHLREHLQFAAAGGLLDPAVVKELEDEQAALSDTAKVEATKASIKQIVKEFFMSEDLPDAVKSLEELNAPFLAFEVVKQLISQSLDQGNRQREGASVFLADQHGASLKSCDIEKGFTILLERVEDLALDIPNILKLFSIFVARAVIDEALAPAFLVRVDLTANDLGSRVLAQAQELLKQENASDRLLWVWEDLTAEENAKKAGTAATGSSSSSSGATATAATEAKAQ